MKKINKILILAPLFCSAMCMGSCGKEETTSQPLPEVKDISFSNENYFHPLGRSTILEKDGKETFYFANSCSGFAFQIHVQEEGTLTFTLEGNTRSPYQRQYAKVYVDDVEKEIFTIENGTFDYSLKESLKTGYHDIRFQKLNEPAFSNITLLEIKKENSLFVPYKNEKKIIEFYGDSITCGYGNLADNTQTFSMETEDGTQSYTQLTANAIGYENSVISYSGIAMSESPFNDEFTLLDRYKTIDGVREWDFSKKADIIVINIGTNDNTKIKTLKGQQMLDAIERYYGNLKTMALDLKGKNPDATFIFAYNMMLPINDGLVTAMESVARELNNMQENSAFTLEFTPESKGADGHPSLEAHQTHAMNLAEFIKSL